MVKLTPWQVLELEAGYGIFAEGAGASAVLRAAGRQHRQPNGRILPLAFSYLSRLVQGRSKPVAGGS